MSHADMVGMSSAGAGERVGVQHISARLLPLLGVKTFLGSIPSADVIQNPHFTGVLISFEFWKRHFDGNPNILGQAIFVDTFAGTIVGVLEPGFDLLGMEPRRFTNSGGCPIRRVLASTTSAGS